MDSTASDSNNQSGLTGWIKLHRQIVDSEVFQDANLLRLWVWLLSKARHTPGFYRVESGKAFKTIPLKIGDVIVGRNKTSQDLGWKPDTYRDRLSRLEKMGMVTLRGTNLCTVVSITNFQHFQHDHDDRDTNHQGVSTPTGHQPDTNRTPLNKNVERNDFGGNPVGNAQPSTQMTKIDGPIMVPPPQELRVRQFSPSKS